MAEATAVRVARRIPPPRWTLSFFALLTAAPLAAILWTAAKPAGPNRRRERGRFAFRNRRLCRRFGCDCFGRRRRRGVGCGDAALSGADGVFVAARVAACFAAVFVGLRRRRFFSPRSRNAVLRNRPRGRNHRLCFVSVCVSFGARFFYAAIVQFLRFGADAGLRRMELVLARFFADGAAFDRRRRVAGGDGGAERHRAGRAFGGERFGLGGL